MSELDEGLFAALAREAKRRVSDFKAQNLANTRWAFAKVSRHDEKLFKEFARESERRVIEFNL